MFAHIARAFPDAPVYTALYDRNVASAIVAPDRVRASFLDRIPGSHKSFRYLAPLYPRAFESFDFSGFDTIVSSTTSWAKGIHVPPGAVHVCYVNTVSRFAYAPSEYVPRAARAIARPLLERLVAWDRAAARRPTRLIANSRNVARRIQRYYGRESDVLHCPVDLERFSIGDGEGGYFIIASRLLSYKRIDLAIAAAAIAHIPLVVTGIGPDEKRLRKLANDAPWIRFTGFVSDAELNHLIGSSRAALVPGEEDFGLVPLEAAAAGRPTLAFRAGGALETIVEGVTGEFFDHPSPHVLAAAMRSFAEGRYDPAALRAHAQKFSPGEFIARLRAIVDETRRLGR